MVVPSDIETSPGIVVSAYPNDGGEELHDELSSYTVEPPTQSPKSLDPSAVTVPTFVTFPPATGTLCTV